VDVAAELADFARQLKAAGEKANRAAGDVFERSAHPVESAIKESAGQRLPRGGGLADAVADSTRVDGNAHMTGSGAAARLAVSSRYDLATLDSGVVHHQVYGRGRSVTQSIPAASGFVTEAVEKQTEQISADLANDVGDALTRALK
jgi:hypothetical protein